MTNKIYSRLNSLPSKIFGILSMCEFSIFQKVDGL